MEVALRAFHLHICCFVVASLLLTCLEAFGQSSFTTTIAPDKGADLSENCSYELSFVSPEAVKGVWVIFDRGPETITFYNDVQVRILARKWKLALLYAKQCRDRESGDVQVVASRGPGDALLKAMTQLAAVSGHTELTSAPVILLGFSATGVLAATMVSYAPERIVASVSYAPGSAPPNGIESLVLDENAVTVPQLIIANSSDKPAGTSRPYEYFSAHLRRGAPWTFAIQNGYGHCCLATAKEFILAWMTAVLRLRIHDSNQSRIQSVGLHKGWTGYMTTREAETLDGNGAHNLQVIKANAQAGFPKRPKDQIDSPLLVWLPDRTAARSWVKLMSSKMRPRAH